MQTSFAMKFFPVLYWIIVGLNHKAINNIPANIHTFENLISLIVSVYHFELHSHSHGVDQVHTSFWFTYLYPQLMFSILNKTKVSTLLSLVHAARIWISNCVLNAYFKTSKVVHIWAVRYGQLWLNPCLDDWFILKVQALQSTSYNVRLWYFFKHYGFVTSLQIIYSLQSVLMVK